MSNVDSTRSRDTVNDALDRACDVNSGSELERYYLDAARAEASSTSAIRSAGWQTQ